MPTLPKARRLLYICDNPGEIIFDRIYAAWDIQYLLQFNEFKRKWWT